VTATFGPQFGQLGPDWGALYRPAEVATLESLPRRMVAFAALHADAFLQYAGGQPYQRDVLLTDLDAQAPAWWQALLDDTDFAHFRALIPYFTPTVEEIAAAPHPAEPWRPLAELLRRGELRWMAVLV
jgi:hypothetical protein